MSRILSILVRNHPGVLSHVAGLFTRRGYNISSIAAGETADPRISRIIIGTAEDDVMFDQITKQLRKLIDVIKVEELAYENSISRELLLLTIFVPQEKRSEIVMLANTFGATVADIAQETMTLEFTGNSLKINNIMTILKGYKIKELARTGLLALTLESSIEKKTS